MGGADSRAVQFTQQATQTLFVANDLLVAIVRKKADSMPGLGQSKIGVAFTKRDSIFGTRWQHSIGLGNTLGHQIVDENADEGLPTRKHQRILAPDLAYGVDSGHEALGSRFLISRGPVDLSDEIQAAYAFGFQRRMQIKRVDEVVLDVVSVAFDVSGFQALN